MFFHRQPQERDPLWRREMRERWRRPVTLFFLALYAMGLSWIAYSLYASLVPAGASQGETQARGIGHQLFTTLLGAQICGWIPFGLLLAAPTIAVERERNSLTEYLLAGLLPQQIARAKFASIATFIIVMCAIPLPVLALCFPLGGVEPMELFAGALLEMAVALACASLGLMISVSHARVTTAMQLGLVMALGLMFLGAPIILALLSSPPWAWLLITAFCLLLMRGTLNLCEEALDDIARHLERHDFDFQPQRLPSPPRVQLQPAQSSNAPRVRDEARRSSFDVWLEHIAGWNAVTQREVRVGVRASRVRMAATFNEETEPVPVRLWAAVGICGAALFLMMGGALWWRFVLSAAMVGTMSVAALGASASFTREREQKMLAQLRMCSLSPFQIVTGKIAATLLLIARGWGGPLVALVVLGLFQNAGYALGNALFVVLVTTFAATLGTTMSLLCRHTSIASGGTLGALLVAFGLLPFGSVSLLFFMPSLRAAFNSFWLGTLWIEPLRAVGGFGSTSLTVQSALWILMGVLLVLNALLLGFSTFLLARVRPDEGETVRFWERDLSRSWR